MCFLNVSYFELSYALRFCTYDNIRSGVIESGGGGLESDLLFL